MVSREIALEKGELVGKGPEASRPLSNSGDRQDCERAAGNGT